jgi:asparagine N-glycosylation enzyme membrane subunit Stt3
MNPQTANQNNPQTDVELRVRTLRTLWFALLLSIGSYYVFTLIAVRRDGLQPNPNLSLTLICVGVVIVLTAFLIKSRLLIKAVDQRNTVMVQQAYIVTWAINEVAALLGLLDFFLTSNRYYYVLLMIAALGLLLHFPRREPVENAAFKSSVM